MDTIFSEKGWAPAPDRVIQGYWLRICVERPCPTHGWIPVLDSACLRIAQENRASWWSPIHSQSLGVVHFLRTAGEGLQDLWNDPTAWENGKIATIGHLPKDLSAFADHWVGQKAVRGWPTDTLLMVHSTPTPSADMRRALACLADAGYPAGQGWALPDTRAGREPDRNPHSAPAHAHLLVRERYGPPQPWDVTTARVTAALTAYANVPARNPDTAWLA